jgi:hypothetical protein
MIMAELKTKQTKESVTAFIAAVEDESKRKECRELLKIFKEVTKTTPSIWGNGVVGYGTYHYKSERSKQEGDWYLTGFSPRKQNLTIYIMLGFAKYPDLMKKLGKYKNSGACLYINKLADVYMKVLKELLSCSFRDMKEKYQ